MEELVFSTLRISAPLVLAALGGLLTFKAGILNIALDGFMIIAAFAAVAVAYATGSLTLGVLAAVACSVALAALLVLFNLRFKAHIFIAGIAVTFIAYGLTALLLASVLGQDGIFTSSDIPTFPQIDIPFVRDIPFIGPIVSGHTLLVYVAYLLVPAVSWLLYKTQWGLRVRFVGEAEEAAAAAGVNVNRIKIDTMLASGFFCGLAGAYLSLGYVTLFAKQMTNDRGLIAIAAIIFAKGNPYATAVVALLFGAASALSIRLPSVTGIAPQILQLTPYIVTVLALVIVGIRTASSRSRHGSWNFDIS
ncbi:ABC transporter permease [Mesorhizobium sp. WSM4887]|uniref:ABC transporter permease n=1 Tax=Mesorhizobium sp. WSM4887 TaxID=3038543 RepID=UPI002415EEE5|nr:ABC transporter permease [Mesorhizobium sp. WSM4887]MDG4889835.1 ABC transporter permease [Mesorhizobium sp. WSM4887]